MIAPSQTAGKYGLHLLQALPPETITLLMDIAATGKLAGITAVNDSGLATAMVQRGVKYVIYREVDSAYDQGPQIYRNETDVQLGREWWMGQRCQTMHQLVDSRVYIQPYGLNESNLGLDGWFWLGVMQAATAQGRRLAVFADSTGTPDQSVDSNGNWHSPVWSNRIASGCLAYGKANGHLANLHLYGSGNVPGATGNEPGSAIFPDGHRDDNLWQWFGGRYQGPYRTLLPEECRMPIIAGECGPFNADIMKMGGIDATFSDFKGYQTRYGDDPDVKAFCYWTVGGAGGWSHSDITAMLPQVLSLLRG